MELGSHSYHQLATGATARQTPCVAGADANYLSPSSQAIISSAAAGASERWYAFAPCGLGAALESAQFVCRTAPVDPSLHTRTPPHPSNTHQEHPGRDRGSYAGVHVIAIAAVQPADIGFPAVRFHLSISVSTSCCCCCCVLRPG